jgi:dynamin-binding protein
MSQMEKVYGDYLKNHDAANKRLQKLQATKSVAIWLQECRTVAEDLTHAWSLDSLLVKPVQRVLKYPLLLSQLLEETSDNHPDFSAIEVAAREMTGVSHRINELKKRVDLVEKVINRKRKESDVRAGISKAFGRRTERLRQQVGLSEMKEDRTYDELSTKFGTHFFQLQVVMRDVEMYTTEVTEFVEKFNGYIQSVEEFIDVNQTNYPEAESKWRKFAMSMREMGARALTEHVSYQVEFLPPRGGTDTT